ncbi:MAG TPA: hypothetical protein VM846_12740 [Vicinamibacterales bacterium]|nr:hypothetical protein [Vicinamibacterales bacterium]
MLRIGMVAGVLVTACGGPASPSSSSLSVGQWNGTTAQGAPIAFTVSPDEILTTLSVGYSFNGCTGTQTFSNLNVSTKPDVTCIPGPCTGTTASFREFAYLSGDRAGTEPSTGVIGLFLAGNQASGQAHFSNYPGCGTATGVPWTATRR